MPAMKVVARIRRMDAETRLPIEPQEVAEVEGIAETYPEARDLAQAKVPEGWQVLAWTVPEHLPD